MAARFADFPAEMKIEIFKFLDENDLIEATLACPEWNKLISTTPAIMKNLVLKIRENHLKEVPGVVNLNYKRLMRLKRHYTSLQFYSFHDDDFDDDDDEYYDDGMTKTRVVRIFKKLGGNITICKLNFVDTSEKFIVKLLKCMPNIVELRIVLHDTESCSIAPVTLNKLKNLWVDDDYGSIFHQLVAPELQKLNFNGTSEDHFLQNFLQFSPKLQYLHTKLENLMGFKYPFHLKTLITNDTSGEDFESMKDFLLSQAASIEFLVARLHNETLIEVLLTKFMHLKSLDLNLCNFEVPDKLSCQLRPMRHLKKITARMGFENDEAIETLLVNCPELVEIDFPEDQNFPNQLDLVARHNKKLEILRILAITSTCNSRFQSLKMLQVFTIKSLPHLICFLTMNPTVENLSIQNFVLSSETANNSFEQNQQIRIRDAQMIMNALSTTNVKYFELRGDKYARPK